MSESECGSGGASIAQHCPGPFQAGALDLGRQIQRLRWQCRRGTLELDLLLNRFLDQRYAELDVAGRANFERLLGYPDQILQDWLIGQAVPADPTLTGLVEAIQGCMLETT